jgi:hypothetical protein
VGGGSDDDDGGGEHASGAVRQVPVGSKIVEFPPQAILS